MGLSLKKVFKGVKKVASVANPLFGAAYDAIGGKKPSQIGKNYVTNNLEGAAASGIGALGAAALPALSGGGTAGGAATAAGAASKMGTLGKIANSPLTPAIIDLAGSTIAGIGQGKQASEDRGEQRREFDLNYAMQKQQADAAEAERQRKLHGLQSTSPLRQDIMAMLAQRLGIQPGQQLAQPQAPLPQTPAPQGAMIPRPAPTQLPVPQAGGAMAAGGAPPQLQAILQRLRQLF